LNRFIRWAGSAAAILAMAFLLFKVWDHLDEVSQLNFSARSIFLVFVSFGLIFSSHIFNIIIWWALYPREQRPPIAVAAIILGKSQLGKYLPGNVFHFLGLFTLAKQKGLALLVVVPVTLAQTLLYVSIALLFGLVGYSDDLIRLTREHLSANAALLAAAGLGFVFLGIVAFTFKKSGLRARVLGAAKLVSLKWAIIASGLVLLDYLVLGISLSVLFEAFYQGTPPHWIKLTTAFTFAWVVGFLTPGAPGGVGIRELVLYSALGSSTSVGATAAIMLLSRLLSILADLFAFLICAGLDKSSKKVVADRQEKLATSQ
jgi:uncharacterized membrane protein YbhN (UPF0104 family)